MVKRKKWGNIYFRSRLVSLPCLIKDLFVFSSSLEIGWVWSVPNRGSRGEHPAVCKSLHFSSNVSQPGSPPSVLSGSPLPSPQTHPLHFLFEKSSQKRWTECKSKLLTPINTIFIKQFSTSFGWLFSTCLYQVKPGRVKSETQNRVNTLLQYFLFLPFLF